MHAKRSSPESSRALRGLLLSTALLASAALGQTFVSTINLPDTFGYGNAPRGLVANPHRAEVYCGGDYPGGLLFISDSTGEKTGFTRAGTNFRPLCVRPNGQWLFGTRQYTLSVIDVNSHAVIRTADVGTSIVAAACRPDGNRLYFVLSSGANLAFLDPAGDSVVGYIALESRPIALALDSTDQKLYLPLADVDRLAVVDCRGDSVLRHMTLSARPHTVAWNGANNRLYAARYGSDYLAVIDCVADTIMRYVAVGDSPVGIAVNSSLNRVYCLNYKDRTVSVIDGATDAVIATIPVGSDPRSIACSPVTGRVYCANYAGYSVTVIDGSTNAVVRSPLVGLGPVEVTCCPQSGRAYVARPEEAAISVLGGPSDTVIGLVTTVGVPVALAVDASRQKLYWSDELNGIAGSVAMPATQSTKNVALPRNPVASVYNPANDRLYVACDQANRVAVIDPGPDTLVALVPVGSGPRRLCLNADGSRLYTANSGAGSVSVVNTTTNAVVATVATGSTPVVLRQDPVRDRLWVLNLSSSTASAVNCTTNAVVATVPVGPQSYDLALNPAGGRAYVPSSTGDSVVVIDLATNTVAGSVRVPDSPTRVLYNPVDNRLYVACFTADSIAIVDCATESLVATVHDHGPGELALSRHGRVWCSSQSGRALTVISPGSERIMAQPSGGSNQVAIVSDSATGLVYTANYGSHTLTAFKDHAVDVAATDVGIDLVYDPGDTALPAGTWTNYGIAPADFDAWLTLRDPLGRIVYSEHRVVAGLAPNRDTTLADFPALALRTVGYWFATCSTRCAGDSVGFDDVISVQFRVGWPGAHGWREEPPMPLSPSGKYVKDGGWLAPGPTGAVYASKGGKTTDFYAYYPGGDSWRALTSIPLGVEARPPYKGACAATDFERYVYAVKGNNRFGFYRYDMQSGTWTEREAVPAGIDNRKPKGGTDVAFVQTGDTGFVYLLKGRTYEFWRYNTVANTWTRVADAPVGAYKWKDGTWLVPVGDTAIYAHKASRHEFWRYDIGAGAWSATALAPMPYLNFLGRNKRSKAGGCAAQWEDRIIALKGGNTQELWQYSLLGGTWTELETIPAYGATLKRKRVKGGADIVAAADGQLYALKGNKTVELWRYQPVLAAARPAAARGDGIQQDAGGPAAGLGLRFEQNPARAGATVNVVGLRPAGSSTLTVVDAAGRVVLTRRLVGAPDEVVRLDLSGLAPGVYFAALRAGDSVARARMVVTR